MHLVGALIVFSLALIITLSGFASQTQTEREAGREIGWKGSQRHFTPSYPYVTLYGPCITSI